MLSRLLDRLVDWWLARCPHDPSYVTADMLEADGSGRQLQVCNRCGAFRWTFGDPFTGGAPPLRYGEWRRPRPLWCGRPA